MIKVFYVMGMMIIGKEECEGPNNTVMKPAKRLIKQPRMIRFAQNEAGQTGVMIGDLVGQPKEMNITRVDCADYVVEDADLKQTYAQAISGLVLPNNGGVDKPDILRRIQ